MSLLRPTPPFWVLGFLLLVSLMVAACSSSDEIPPGIHAVSDDITVTLHDYADMRPAEDLYSASVTIANSSRKIPKTRKFQELSCLLEDTDRNVVGYKNCGTQGLLPGESFSHQLNFLTLSPEPAVRLSVLDGTNWEELASFDLVKGSATGAAHEIDENAYQSERYQGQNFSSPGEWSALVEEWESRRPGRPGPARAAKGAKAGLNVSKQLDQDKTIRNDKWKHCVLGAEIAEATSTRVGVYAGWLKEYQDLTDGDSGSGFDEVDFEATADGARNVKTNPFEVCGMRWGDRYGSWDGTMPPL